MATTVTRARLVTALSVLKLSNKNFLACVRCISATGVNYGQFPRWKKPYLFTVNKKLKRQRMLEGYPKPKPRSWWSNWSYDAELFSFGARLGENFDNQVLRRAFLHRSHVEKERREREEVGVPYITSSSEDNADSVKSDLALDNTDLIEEGKNVTSNYVKAFTRCTFPRLPEECVTAIHDFLLSSEHLVHISKGIGCTDLIFAEEFPVSGETLVNTFHAVVAALSHSQGRVRAERLVEDFVISRLTGVDVNDVWFDTVTEPLHTLNGILTGHGLPHAEPRIVGDTGKNFIMACYNVGIYCNRQLIAQAPGESVDIAVNMACRRALTVLWGMSEGMPAYRVGPSRHGDSIPERYWEPHPTLAEWARGEGAGEHLQQYLITSSHEAVTG